MCFTGHRELEGMAPVLKDRLQEELEILYRKGYRRFLNGGALGFDQLAAECVIRLREKYPEVRLLMAVPCETQSSRWSPSQKERYQRILAQADECRVLASHYYNGCMIVRNRYMVDRSSCCVCFLQHPKGGTMSTVAYAAARDLTIINLAEDGLQCGPGGQPV